ncbi:MAG: hypothetical protein K2X11_21205 [Acetobacteraceae bacterium]|nr:hypothetical protein [Acetobacteraceae bacterium]
MRVVFDENTPRVVAHAVKLIAEAEAAGGPEPLEVLHALDLMGGAGAPDTVLVQRVAEGAPGKAALVTSDKAMRTRQHERAAYGDTGCVGIVLRGSWNHASMWERARMTLLWWTAWRETVAAAAPGTLWQCPWHSRPGRLKPF